MSIQSGVNTVQFKSQGYLLSGVLFTPNDFNAAKQYPTVVFAGPFNQVKEQTGTVYGNNFLCSNNLLLFNVYPCCFIVFLS